VTACGEKDENCQDACYQAYGTACQPLGDACANFEDCADASCSGGDPCSGGGGGNGGNCGKR
jgi:hypothetical protein